MGKKKELCWFSLLFFLKPKVFSCFLLKGGWLRGDRNDLKKITSNVFLRLLLFVSSSHVLPSIQKKSITFQAGLDLHLHRQACLNTSSRTRSNFKLTWVTCFLFLVLALTMILLDSFFFLVCTGIFRKLGNHPCFTHQWVFGFSRPCPCLFAMLKQHSIL